VLRAVELQYRLQLGDVEALEGGVESQVIKVRGSTGPVVVRVAPRWRSLGELTWAYELAAYAATRIPAALAPMRAEDGSLAIRHDDRVVSVFPFVHGSPLDRTNGRERDSAAALLARLHRVLPLWDHARPRPPSGPGAPTLRPDVEPPGLTDRALDTVVGRFAARFAPALTHGDYYRGNVRCVDHEIVALFDWDDACYWTLENELAWSVWEFAQADKAPTLDVDRAEQFLRTYAAHGGPVSLSDRSFIVPFIRDDIRTDIREAAALAEAGIASDPGYVERSNAAFANLATVTL
jgi:Ser/Thr protein kinase RdoA (MazF antagonist)